MEAGAAAPGRQRQAGRTAPPARFLGSLIPGGVRLGENGEQRDGPRVVEVAEQGQKDRQAEQARHAEKMGAHKHAHQRQHRMQADLLAHDPGLDDVADDSDDHIHHQQRQRPGEVPLQRREDHPGDHDAAGAQHGENVENGDQQSHQHGPLHADEAQADGQLQKRDAHDEGVGADAHKQRAHHIGLDLEDHPPGAALKAAQAESHDPVIVHGDEEGGNHHQQQPDQKARQGGGQGGGCGHAAHHQHRKAGDQLPQHIHQLGLQLLQRRAQGGVQPGKEVLQPGEHIGQLREDVGGIQRGDLLDQGGDGNADPNTRQGQQQADDPVGEHHQQHRRQPLWRMERPGQKHDGPPQQIGDDERQGKGRQQRQRILQQKVAQCQDQRQIQDIHNEFFLSFSRQWGLRSGGDLKKRSSRRR